MGLLHVAYSWAHPRLGAVNFLGRQESLCEQQNSAAYQRIAARRAKKFLIWWAHTVPARNTGKLQKEGHMINPTVGRVVLFHPGRHFSGCSAGADVPLPALIARVWSDTCVNIGGFDANGLPFSATSVLLIQDSNPVPDGGHYCEWMPYQKGQAAKTEALQEALVSAKVA